MYWKRPSWKSHNEAALITLLNDYPVAIPYYAHVLYMNYFFNAFTFDLVYLLPVVVLYGLLLRFNTLLIGIDFFFYLYQY